MTFTTQDGVRLEGELRLPDGASLVLHLGPSDTAVAAGRPARVAWPIDQGVCLVA